MTDILSSHPEAFFGLVGTLIGALVSTFVPVIQSAIRDLSEQKKASRYLAIRVACVLRKYYNDCAKVASDDGSVYGQPANQDGTHSPQVSAPPPISYPDDLDWKSIDHNLMYDLLSLPGDSELIHRLVESTWDHATPPDYDEYFEERQLQYALLGVRALSLEKRLMLFSKISTSKPLAEWDIEKHFQEKIRSIHITRQMRSESQLNFFNQITENIKSKE